MRRIHDQDIHTGLNQCRNPVIGFVAGAHTGAHHQLPGRILASVGVGLGVVDVLDRDHAAQAKVVVHD